MLVATGGKIDDDLFNVCFQNINIMKIAKIVKMEVEEDFPDRSGVGEEGISVLATPLQLASSSH